jgi:hypothetical protein
MSESLFDQRERAMIRGVVEHAFNTETGYDKMLDLATNGLMALRPGSPTRSQPVTAQRESPARKRCERPLEAARCERRQPDASGCPQMAGRAPGGQDDPGAA